MADQHGQNYDETGAYQQGDQAQYDYDQQYDQQQQYDQGNEQYYDQGNGEQGNQYDSGTQYNDHQQEANDNYAGGDGVNGEYDPNDQDTGEYTSLPEVLFLNHYCASAHAPRDNSEEAKQEADLSWEPVRDWLRNHSAEEVRAAAEQLGDSAMTALHLACRNKPPKDVIDVLLAIAVDTAAWPDSFGWLPIHYACACGADTDVIKSLGEAFPVSKTTVDRRGRTPLHFALGNSSLDNPVLPVVIMLLSTTGAAAMADDSGMLPLHYACAYGASEEALMVLTPAYDKAITTTDRFGRTPLHFALSNAGRESAPAAVRLLLSSHKKIVNTISGGPLPLRVLQEFASNVPKDDLQSRESVFRCLELLLSFNPDPTADFFTALQSLPDWLRERAVVMPIVQLLLNEKIAQRFPTGVLLSDLFFQLLIIGFYGFSVNETIKFLTKAEPTEISIGYIIPLYLGATYFLLRTVVRTFSLIALKAFQVLLKDVFYWLDLCLIYILYYWSVKMQRGDWGSDEAEIDKSRNLFVNGTAISAILVWSKLLGYLRNTYIDFAVFLGGLFYVVRRLTAFIICLFIILLMFSFMFFSLYYKTEVCFQQEALGEPIFNDDTCAYEIEPYCDRWSAFLHTYTMLLGEVDATQFEGSLFATLLFSLFMFLVVILLANVLIAIVTDSYKVIQDQRAAIVFWTNRLDFVAEMDAILNGPWQKGIRRMLGMNVNDSLKETEITFGKEFWKRLMDLFEADVDDSAFSLESICHTLMLVFVTIVVIPLWLILGLLTFGILWPPQIREAVFTSKVLQHSSAGEVEDELRKTQVKVLKQEVKTMKDDIRQELAMDRTQVVQIKSLIAERKQDIQNEMKHIKRIVAMLFEQQASM